MMSDDTFAKLPNWLLRRRDVGATGKCLWARLSQYQGTNADAWPSAATLADEIGISDRQVLFHLKILEQHNLVEITRRVGYRASNRYKMIHPPTTTENCTTGNSTTGNGTRTSAENGMSLVRKSSHKEIKKRFKEKIQFPVEVPASLNVPSFLEAWKDFELHRSELNKRLTPLAAQKQLAVLAAIGPDRAVVAINHSIAQGWQSIHEPQGGQHGNNNRSGRITGGPNKYEHVGTTIG